MSSTLRLSDRQLAARATAAAAASLADLQQGSAPPEVRIYTAPRPASVAAGPGTAALLVAVQLADPAGTVDGTDLLLTQAADALIAATGNPAWALLVDGNGQPCADLSAGPAPTDPADPVPDIVINQPTLYAGGYLRLSPLVISNT